MKKDAILAQIRAERVIALMAAASGETLISCALALAAGGLHALEVAMTTPAAIGAVEHASAAMPDFHFGMGTVLDAETAQAAILAGASFLVTPSPRPDVITLCRRYGTAVISSAFSASDISVAHAAGADAVKVIPGELFGPAYIRSLKASLPDVEMIPIGGVTPLTVAEFLRAGAMAAVAGSSLLDPMLVANGNWGAITERAALFVGAVRGFVNESTAGCTVESMQAGEKSSSAGQS